MLEGLAPYWPSSVSLWHDHTPLKSYDANDVIFVYRYDFKLMWHPGIHIRRNLHLSDLQNFAVFKTDYTTYKEILPKSACLDGNYTPRFNEVERGVYWFLSICPSICRQNRVRSVSSTILVGSFSYLHILSSNCRRCVMCSVYFFFFQNSRIWNIGKLFKFVTLTLSSLNAGVLVVLVLFAPGCLEWVSWCPKWRGMAHIEYGIMIAMGLASLICSCCFIIFMTL